MIPPVEGVKIEGNFTENGIYREKKFGNLALYSRWEKPTEEAKLNFSFRVFSSFLFKQKQKGDLLRQIETIKANFPIQEYEALYEITDISSGLNDKRKGLLKLISLAQEEKISDVVITFKDRLTRFGYNYLEQFFSFLGVKIHFLSLDDKETVEQELVKDMLAIVTSFSGKLYGMRSHKKKRIVEHVKEVLRD